MLKRNPDPLARSFDDVLHGWLAQDDPTRAIRVNFRQLVGANSGIDRFTHLLHPYPAKLLLNIPLFFLNCHELGGPGDTVLDPFCGSGTVLLEGLLRGRRVIGYDSNPLARLISKAKTTVLNPEALEAALEDVLASVPRRGEGAPEGSLDLTRWYTPRVIAGLDRLATAIRRLPRNSETQFLQACFSSVVRKVSLADPTVSVPVMLNPSKSSFGRKQQQTRREWLEAKQSAKPIEEFKSQVRTNIARMAKLHEYLDTKPARPRVRKDARQLIEDERVDLVITSPPYGSAQKYVRSTSLSLQWLELSGPGLRTLERLSIGREHYNSDERVHEPPIVAPSSARLLEKIGRKNKLRQHIAANYLFEMHQALKATAAHVRPGGHLVFVVGNNVVCDYPFDTRRFLVEMCESLGLTLRLTLVDRIRSRGLLTKRHETSGVICQEWILVFRKQAKSRNV